MSISMDNNAYVQYGHANKNNNVCNVVDQEEIQKR